MRKVVRSKANTPYGYNKKMYIEINDFAIDISPVGILLLVIVLVILRRQGRSGSYLACFALFWVYILLALKVTLFPIPINGQYVDVMRQIPLMSHVNLKLFAFGPYGINRVILIMMAQNILLTVPFGFGLNFVTHIRARNFLWLPVAVGCGIEIVQLIISLALGYPYRVIDINDALLNAVGVLLGYVLFRGFAWGYVSLMRRLKIEPRK
jgi:glycopeptide antibiotics resistance protein